MKNSWASFVLICAIVLAVAGGAIYLNRVKTRQANSNQNNQTQDELDTSADQDTKYKEDLAKYLTEKGAVLYGAYWCPHCNDQKDLFGDAAKYLNYVECDSRGENANPDECIARDVQSYPTWIYQDQQYTGTQSLSRLAGIVDFSGSSQSTQSVDDNLGQSDPALNNGF